VKHQLFEERLHGVEVVAPRAEEVDPDVARVVLELVENGAPLAAALNAPSALSMPSR
jgi:hypothetical protein